MPPRGCERRALCWRGWRGARRSGGGCVTRERLERWSFLAPRRRLGLASLGILRPPPKHARSLYPCLRGAGRSGVRSSVFPGFEPHSSTGIPPAPGSCPFAKRQPREECRRQGALWAPPSSASCLLAPGNSMGNFPARPRGSPSPVRCCEDPRRLREELGRAALGGASGSGRARRGRTAGDKLSQASSWLREVSPSEGKGSFQSKARACSEVAAFLLLCLQCLRAEKPRQYSPAGGHLLGAAASPGAAPLKCSYLVPLLSHLILATPASPSRSENSHTSLSANGSDSFLYPPEKAGFKVWIYSWVLSDSTSFVSLDNSSF